MRLCFVVPEYASRPPMGGIATYARDTARWLVQHGHSVHVVCVTRTSPPGKEDDDGVQVYFVTHTRIRPRQLLRMAGQVPGLAFLQEAYAGWDLLENSLGAWRTVWHLDRRMKFDVIECADFGGLAFWGLLSPARPRILLRGHAYLNLELPHVDWAGRRFHQALERYCARQARLIAANSAFLAASYREQFGVDERRITVIPCGLVLPTSTEKASSLRSERNWHANPIVLYVGRLEEQKGTDLLFAALTLAKKAHPELRAVLLGTTSDRFLPTYQAFMSQNQEWVWHPGAVPPQTVREIMQQVDIVVLPSRTETFGRVLVEAQLCGCAVMGMRLGGMPEIIEDGVTGLLVQPDDTQALADAIRLLFESPELRLGLAAAGKANAQQRYGMDSVMENHLNTYQAMIPDTAQARTLNTA